jgi:H+/Cl- antiporter ClcA
MLAGADMGDRMKRLKNCATSLLWTRLNPRACAWIAYTGLVAVSVAAVISIFLFFVPDDPSQWARDRLLMVAMIAAFAQAAGTLGLWRILCLVSRRVRQWDALVGYALGWITILVGGVLLVLFLLF